MRPIDADEAKRFAAECWPNPVHRLAIDALLDNCPTIDPKDLQPHGRWDGDHCTNCGGLCVVTKDAAWRTRYCPNCGAKMDEECEE